MPIQKGDLTVICDVLDGMEHEHGRMYTYADLQLRTAMERRGARPYPEKKDLAALCELEFYDQLEKGAFEDILSMEGSPPGRGSPSSH